MSSPWDDVPHVWKDEQAFLNWMRSQTRRIWSRHPIKVEYVKARKVPVSQVTGEWGHCCHPRTKFAAQCEKCEKWWAVSRMEVDHLQGGTGFNDWPSFLLWQDRMLRVGFDDIQHLCKPCHHRITMCQKFGCTEKEVDFYIDRAAFRRLKAKDQKLALKALKLPPGKNGAEREAIFTKHLEKKYGFTLRP